MKLYIETYLVILNKMTKVIFTIEDDWKTFYTYLKKLYLYFIKRHSNMIRKLHDSASLLFNLVINLSDN